MSSSDTRSRLFRKVALARLSSPEQLDTLVRVVSVKAWLALMPFLALLLLAAGWSWCGTVPTKVVGKAILFQRGGLRSVTTDSSGRISTLKVSLGDTVTVGQVVAIVAQPELETQVRSLNGRLEELQRQEAEQKRQTSLGKALSQSLLGHQSEALKRQLDVAKERVRVAAERIKSQQTLLDQGLITRQAFLDTQNDASAVQQDVENVENSLKGNLLRGVEDDKRALQELTKTANEIGETRRMLVMAQAAMAGANQVVSSHGGRVVELKIAPGTLVTRGSALLTLEQVDGKDPATLLEAVIFIPAAEGKKVRPGMEAQIVPSTVKREEHGFMLSQIRYVSEYAATDESMMAILQNRQIVQELSAGNSPIEVRATLIPGKTTSGYRWSSTDGPPFGVRTGTLGSVEIVVSRQSPISLVIPALKKSMGMD